MLVVIDDSDMPVAIAVCEWKINGEERYFVLLPYQINNQYFVKVEVAFSVKVISEATPEWQPIENGFGDDSVGYQMDKQTTTDLYNVWDNGATVETEASERLYNSFLNLIEHYQEEANQQLMSLYEDEYNHSIAEAKRNGWDSSLVDKRDLSFPYFSASE